MKNKSIILRLPIKRIWFDAILSGQKTEEYRDVSPYYCARLLDDSWKFKFPLASCKIEVAEQAIKSCPRLYHFVEFRAGYTLDSPKLDAFCNGISIGYGKSEWGAPIDRKVFIIKLGGVISSCS